MTTQRAEETGPAGLAVIFQISGELERHHCLGNGHSQCRRLVSQSNVVSTWALLHDLDTALLNKVSEDELRQIILALVKAALCKATHSVTGSHSQIEVYNLRLWERLLASDRCIYLRAPDVAEIVAEDSSCTRAGAQIKRTVRAGDARTSRQDDIATSTRTAIPQQPRVPSQSMASTTFNKPSRVPRQLTVPETVSEAPAKRLTKHLLHQLAASKMLPQKPAKSSSAQLPDQLVAPETLPQTSASKPSTQSPDQFAASETISQTRAKRPSRQLPNQHAVPVTLLKTPAQLTSVPSPIISRTDAQASLGANQQYSAVEEPENWYLRHNEELIKPSKEAAHYKLITGMFREARTFSRRARVIFQARMKVRNPRVQAAFTELFSKPENRQTMLIIWNCIAAYKSWFQRRRREPQWPEIPEAWEDDGFDPTVPFDSLLAALRSSFSRHQLRSLASLHDMVGFYKFIGKRVPNADTD